MSVTKRVGILLLFAIAAAWGQAPTFTISTIAGNTKSGYSGNGGPATSAELDDPRGIVTDPVGNVYFCDRENNVVRKIDLNGVITTVAGTGIGGYNGDNIQGTSAQLNTPWRVTLDPAGNLYIADAVNDRIRKLAPNGIITTVVGNGQAGYSGDGGPATSATLRIPEQAELDAFGNLYIADSGNNVIRKVNTAGVITTVAGNGFGAGVGNSTGTGKYSGDGGPATQASLSLPVSVAVDPSGNLFISDQLNNVIRKVDTTGKITTVAGISTRLGYAGDGGPATSAVFYYPAGIALDSAGDLYITDVNNDALRVMLASGVIWTVAGNGNPGYSGDGGAAASAELQAPRQVAVGTFGDVYVADSGNNVIRKLTSPKPTIGHVVNAFGNIQLISGNTWISIQGTDLARAGDSRIWQASDFANGQMPTALDGVSVTLSGANGYQSSAYMYYISPTQLNILVPPDAPAGVVQLQVTNNGTASAPASVVAQTISPSFFVFNGGPYAVATHLNGSLVGPTTLFPGSSTPAQPGEEVVVYANGFGPTSSAITKGSEAQSGSLAVMPVIQIGGVSATVLFAGLISPGLYQFNVIVPMTAVNGDNSLTAQYNGQSAQTGVLLTVQ